MLQLTEMTAVSAVSPISADLPSAKNFPFKKFTFADGKILFCHLSDINFADGQRRTCRLPIFCLPSANETFADGKCLAGRRQNSYRINGKFFVCHRQIFQCAVHMTGSYRAVLTFAANLLQTSAQRGLTQGAAFCKLSCKQISLQYKKRVHLR